jgi:phospholipid transport system substrate-binding protein
MKKLFWAIFCSLIICQAVMAQDKNAAERLLRCKLDAVICVLQQKDLSEQEKSDRVTGIVTPMFDFSRMAKLTLGKRYWPGLSIEEREKFTESFTRRLQESYLSKLLLYKDEKVVYESPVEEKRKIYIPTNLVSGNNTISILYKFYNTKNNWKIYDIEIQGISIIQSYRSQFTEVLLSGTIDDLLSELERPVDK